jgi:metal-responsive CopG/Arc/MetJ family transcriptional regulator
MHRTTVMLQDELYREVKRKAIDRGRPMRVLVEEAIRAYLGLAQRLGRGKPPKFGVYNARVIGSLRRADIYKEHLRHKMLP